MRAVILVLLTLILPAITLRAQPRLPPIAWLSDRDGDYDVYVWDGEQTINVSSNDTLDSYLQPSPDGQFAWRGVVGESSEVFVWDGAQTINVSNSPSLDIFPVWSQDGRLAWFSEQTDERGFSLQVAVWDGAHTTLLGREFGSTDVPNLSNNYIPVWSQDGRLAWSTVDAERSVQVYVWDGVQVIRVMEFAAEEPLELAWLPNGYLLLDRYTSVSDVTWSLWLWDGDHVTSLLESTSGILEWTLWGDDQVAFRVGTSTDAPVYIWTEMGAVRINPEQSGLVGYPAGSAQGQIAWIAEIAGTPTPRLYVWDGAAVQDVGRADESFPGPRWSVDGRLAWNTQTADGMHIYVWDGETISDIPPDESQYDSELMWLPDGRLAWQSGDYPAQELKFWDRGRIGTITAGVGPIRDVRVFLAGLLWTQEIDGNSEVFLWDTTQTINVSADPGWDGLTLVPPMG